MENPIRGLARNTFPRTNPVTALRGFVRYGGAFFVACLLILSGCGPKYTYPAGKVPDSVVQISKKEYKLDVTARVVGKTVGAILYLDALADDQGQISKDVNEKMSKVMQVVTRVALSTDLPLDFCTVIVREKATGNQLVITKSMDDTKRANADAIGIEESINRTLFSQDKYDANAEDAQAFVLKEVKQENFLADQIVQRIRFNFAKEAKQDNQSDRSFVIADGNFERQPDKRTFRFSVIALKADDPKQLILGVFKVVNRVLQGYKFTDFDWVEIQDYLNRQKLFLDRETILAYQQKKISDNELLERFLTESQSIQEAFKLFGFTMPQTSQDNTDVPVATKPTP